LGVANHFLDNDSRFEIGFLLLVLHIFVEIYGVIIRNSGILEMILYRLCVNNQTRSIWTYKSYIQRRGRLFW